MSVISMRVYKPLLPKDLDVTRIHQNIFSFFNPGQKTRKTGLYSTGSLSLSILQVMQLQIWKKVRGKGPSTIVFKSDLFLKKIFLEN